MNARTTAARRGHGAGTRRPAAAPAIPRRVSGPVARPVPGQPAAVPAGRVAARPRPLARAAALPDHRLIERLLRGRLWIWFIGLALGGIVAMQVSLLKLNTGISRAVQTSATLEMQNASLQAGIARLSSQERIQREVTALGMQIPEAGDLEHVRVRGPRDGARAARRMTEPSEQARQVLATAGALSGQAGMGATPEVGAPTGATAPGTPSVPATQTVPTAGTAPATATTVSTTPVAAPAAPAVPVAPAAAAQVTGAPQG